MLIYYESKIKELPLTHQIFEQFKNSEKIEIQHYKNLFDYKIWNYTTKPLIILAKQEHIAILPTPKNYWFPWKSFFFKPSLNCFFNCKYCYLQWTFRNRFPIFFLNYEDIQKWIINQIEKEKDKWFTDQITFYASNYADLLATENISHFHENFLPFCETLPNNILIETRTKSANISALLNYAKNLKWKSPTQKMEIAFSISPHIIAKKYEKWTATLDEKTNAINKLIKKWFRIWLRFLPLLPIKDFQQIYSDFLDEIISKIDINKTTSITIAPLIFNQWDYNILLKKYQNDSDFSFINNLQHNEHKLRTCSNSEISRFKEIFTNKFKNKNLFRDYI